jgi:alpha-beta hydrolase superfamily lysophospholipase
MKEARMGPAARKMVPLHFGSPERTLFGWYHAPQASPRAAAVVLCNPIGDDIVRAHRTFRHLAERLAAIGFPVLRFDFHGTGDSAADERAPERVAAWIDDVGAAAACVRARSGARALCLAGLRLGGTLAAAWAARAGGVERLILWAPYAHGEGFVRETLRQHAMHQLLEPEGFAAEPPGYDPGGRQALGFLLTPSTIADLERLDLLAETRRPAERVLVIGASNEPAEERLLEYLRGRGAAVEYRHFPGHKFLISIPHQSVVPMPVLDALVGWAAQQHPPGPAAAAGGAPAPFVAAPPAAAPPADEHPLFFGPAARMFGLLTRPPPGRQSRARPAIVLLNAGTVHRIGPHRLYVRLARAWAALGFFTFRVDLSGIGDSPPADGAPENLCYPPSGIADVQAAMRALENELGIERFVLVGLCSGADLAFQTAFRDPRAAGAIMMNPRTFCVHDLEMVESAKRAGYYLDSLLDRRKLQRLLRGELKPLRALGMLALNVRGVVSQRLRSLGRWLPTGAPRLTDVPGCLGRMAARGVDTLLLVSEHDPGVEYVDLHFGARMRALTARPRFRRVDLRGADHTFTSLYMQQIVSDLLTEHLVGGHS